MTTSNTATEGTTQDIQTTEETTAPTKLVELSARATKWCRRVAGVAIRKAFQTKTTANHLQTLQSNGGAESLKFHVLPKIYQRKRISHTDGAGNIFIHPDFLDQRGNLRRKMDKTDRDELKAAIFKEVVRQVLPRQNVEFYKVMGRCPWVGARVDGAKGSPTASRTVLEARRKERAERQRTVTEVATGLTEDVTMWDLVGQKHVLVKNAEIFLVNGSIKVARGTSPDGRKLRTMLSGGAALRAKLGL